MSKPVFTDLFRLSGRRNRKSYMLLLLFCLSGWAVVLTGLLNIATSLSIIIVAAIGVLVYVLGNLVIWIAGAQRCRDVGWSGRYMLLVAAPCIVLQPLIFVENLSLAMITVVIVVTAAVWLFLLCLIVIPGARGPNLYGADPLAAIATDPPSAA